MLAELEHENVVKLQEVIEDENCKELYIVMGYLEKGEVLSWDGQTESFAPNPCLLDPAHKDGLSLRAMRRVVRDIVAGLSFGKLSSSQQQYHPSRPQASEHPT